MAENYDLIVIGSGPGGYVTAIRAAQLGLKTAIVEREHLGGICLNWGCIPTKALLRSAEILHFGEHAKDYGLKLEGTITPDVKAVVQRSRGVSARLNGGVGFLMKKNKIDVIWGEAKIVKPGEIVAVGEQSIRICVQGGALEVLKVRTEAGKKMSAADFARSHGLTAGARLESDAVPVTSFAAAAS